MAAYPRSTTNAVLLRRWQDHRSLSTVLVRVALLQVGKGILPVVLLERGKACDAVHAKVYYDGVGILLGEVANRRNIFAIFLPRGVCGA